MHPLKKFYCRAFQLCFHIALPILPYREPKILNSGEAAAALLKERGIGKVLIVTDGGIVRCGLADQLTGALKAKNIRWEIYDRTVPNPTIENVEEARAQYLAAGCQALLALGGGSAIDCAKAAGARLAKPRMPVAKMRGILHIRRRLPLLIAAPTTAGTGSETTLAAVITDAASHYKYPINDFVLIPRYALLDWQLTRGLPPALTATTGMDALTHAVEAYIGGSTNRYTRAMAEEAVCLIRTHLQAAYRDGSSETARRGMLRAAFCAGNAFSRSYVGYVHGIAHSLGGQYSLPHGLANAVALPWVLEAYGEACHSRLAKLAKRCGAAPEELSDSQAARAFIRWIREMNESMNIPRHIDCIRPEDIPVMARHADRECNPLYPVPRLMDAQELEHLYHIISGKYPEKEAENVHCRTAGQPAPLL